MAWLCLNSGVCVEVKQVGEVLRALGQNPTEGEVRKLVQSSCKVKVPEVIIPSFHCQKPLEDCNKVTVL